MISVNILSCDGFTGESGRGDRDGEVVDPIEIPKNKAVASRTTASAEVRCARRNTLCALVLFAAHPAGFFSEAFVERAKIDHCSLMSAVADLFHLVAR